ncbi:MocR-like ectoine utilization transcription factor EhuR [Rhizobium brockwellii]|uniref:MocR-like ectoine utilization transcription factor EhuR n=1 Tax=Rhizobium brockwellii TaxID=3019932 RepID=UPI003F986018
MTIWRPRADILRRPVYVSLADQIASAIDDGKLVQGVKLPAHRDLAYDLKISIQTVSKAYEILARRGLVTGETGRGTYVKSNGDTTQMPYIADRPLGIVDLSIVTPVCTNLQLEKTKEALADLSANLNPSSVLSFRPNAVMPRHQEASVRWLAELGVDTAPENVIITNGASAGITTALMSVAGSGAVVAAEEICYHVIRPLCDYLGIRVRAISADKEGMVADHLRDVCSREQVRTVLVQPNISNPTACLMSGPRRQKIAEVASQLDVAIIEIDVFGPLLRNRPLPIAAYAPERTIYITGLTKAVLPGLRIAYIAAPAQYAPPIANRHLMANWMATPLVAEIATTWLEDDTVQAMIEWQRDAINARQQVVKEVLDGASYQTHPEALHLWLTLPADHDELAFVSHARLRGVALAPSSPFTLNGHSAGAVRVAVGVQDLQDLRSALGTISSLLRAKPDRNILPV